LDIGKIRADFPALKEWTYLDNSFVGLIPRQVKEGYDEFIDEWVNLDIKGDRTILSGWLGKTNKLRGMVADFIGAMPHEIAFTMCTGAGINVVVNGISWEKGDNVVFPEWEHNPLDTTTLRRNGVEIRALEVKDGRTEVADLEKIVDDNTKLIEVSQVSYVNGFRFDLKEVADVAHEHGSRVLVDATQALGALVTDVGKDGVDFLSAAPYKYLMGPAGLAFLYVKEDALSELEPDRIGWKNQIWEGDRAEEPPEDKESAEKFEYGTIHFQGVYALEKSLEYINGIGMEAIEKRVLELSGYLWNEAHDLGNEMYTPEGTKSPIVSFFEPNASEVASKLMAEKVKVTGREAHGGHIRASPHFYNTKAEIDRLIERYRDIVS
jgi:cysteine desulfurase/selenocysteine lyase